MSGSESPDSIAQQYTAGRTVNVQLRDHCYKISLNILLKIRKESANKTLCIQVQRTSFSNQTNTYITRFIQQSNPRVRSIIEIQ